MDGVRVDIACASVAMLIGYAYRLSPDRISGLDGLTGARFDIAARIPQGASLHQVPEMLQSLLAERFGLAVHRRVTRGTIYALAVARGGLKMKAAPAGPSFPAAAADASDGATTFFGGVEEHTSANPNGGRGAITISSPAMGTVMETGDPRTTQRWEAPSISLEGMADLLDKVAPFLSSPVIDVTGLKGRYQAVLEVSLNNLSSEADPTSPASTPLDMEEAVAKRFNDGLRRLGLQMERRQGPVETLFVDHAGRTPTAN